MNVEGEQNASASGFSDNCFDRSSTAGATDHVVLSTRAHSPTQATPATSPPAAAADLPAAAAAAGTNMTAPASPHQQRLKSTRSVSVSPPKHDLFGGCHTPWFITPPHLSQPQTHPVGVRTCYHTPWFITPPHLSHTQTYPVGGRTCYHTPWFITPPGGRRDQHSITGATQDTTPPTGYHTR